MYILSGTYKDLGMEYAFWGENVYVKMLLRWTVMNIIHVLLTLKLLEVINMKLLPIIFIHHPAEGKWEYLNLSGRSCYLDLIPNSPYLYARNCVKAGGENWQLDIGSERVKILLEPWKKCISWGIKRKSGKECRKLWSIFPCLFFVIRLCSSDRGLQEGLSYLTWNWNS